MNPEIMEEAYAALPEHFKSHPETRIVLAFSETAVVVTNPEYAAMIYKKEKGTWADLTFTDHKLFMEGTL